MAHIHPKRKLAIGKHRPALAAMLAAATLATQVAAADEKPFNTGTPFWDDATAGYMFRT